MFFIHGMGRFWGLAEDKMPVASPRGGQGPYGPERVSLPVLKTHYLPCSLKSETWGR